MKYNDFLSDLKLRLREIANKFKELELIHFIALARLEVIQRIMPMARDRLLRKTLFTTAETYGGSYAAGGVTDIVEYDIPDYILEIKRVIFNYIDAQMIRADELISISNNSYYSPSATNPYYYLIGNKIGFRDRTPARQPDKNIAAIAAGVPFELWYIVKPLKSDMFTSSDEFLREDKKWIEYFNSGHSSVIHTISAEEKIIPEEYQEQIINYAEILALKKTNDPRMTTKINEYNTKYQAILNSHIEALKEAVNKETAEKYGI